DEIKKSGMTPDEIIKNRGEPEFRKIEAETIKNLSDKNGLVIATGGGAVLREENIKRLKRNGKIVFLDRDLSDILPTPDRPLSQNRELLKKRYDERFPIYTSVSDIKVKIGNDANENAENIIKILRG
ncbi:MAG: shikimate kinase, partial [Clostridia bacterium]|nr:shikimate kinase [Clostridia bacterium]